MQLYKNTIDKDPNVNDSLITWMHKECERTGTEKDGGLIFDEMHLQPGVPLDPSGDGLKMFGFVDFGAYSNGINMYRKGQGLNIATTVLHFVFSRL